MSVAEASGLLAELLAGPRPAEWKALREAAEARLETQDWPSTRQEAWKYTDLKGLQEFRPAAELKGCTEGCEQLLGEHLLPESRGTRLVFVNGRFSAHLSNTSALPPGVRLLRLASASEAAKLGSLARVEDNDPFANLNSARFEDGAYLFVPQGLAVEPVLQVLSISEAGACAFPRLFVHLERGARATLVEEHTGTGRSLSCPVVEVELEAGAEFTHERVQQEAPEAFHLGTLAARLHRDSVYRVRTASFGARLSRQSPRVILAEEGAHLELDGLALLGGEQLADTHSRIDHAVPHGQSRQLHKSIVDGSSRSVFNGKILVHPGAQQTDARQQARSLLLSEQGRVDAKPELEIYADDVKCAHGAAIGQLDPEELFYLRSRGMSPQLARNLLTYAFAADVLSTIPVASLRRRLRKLVLERTCAEGLEV